MSKLDKLDKEQGKRVRIVGVTLKWRPRDVKMVWGRWVTKRGRGGIIWFLIMFVFPVELLELNKERREKKSVLKFEG